MENELSGSEIKCGLFLVELTKNPPRNARPCKLIFWPPLLHNQNHYINVLTIVNGRIILK